MENEILATAKKPSTLKYLLNHKCILQQLTNLISMTQQNRNTSYNGDIFSQEYSATFKSHQDDSSLEALLKKPYIQALINYNGLTFNHFIEYWPLTFLEDERVCQLVQLGVLSIKECYYSVRNNKDFLRNIQLPVFSRGLMNNCIDDISGIPQQTKQALALSTIESVMQYNEITLSKLNSLSWAQKTTIYSGLWSQQFSISEPWILTTQQCSILSMENAQLVLSRLFTSYRDLLKLEQSLQKRVLKILEMKISEDCLSTVYELQKDSWGILTRYKKQFISSNGIVDIGKLTQLNKTQCKMLLFPGTHKIVAANILSFTAASTLALTKMNTDVLATYKQTIVNSKDIDPQTVIT